MELNCKNRTVFIGDNREVMLGLNAEIADAIITDPPFNSGQMRKDDTVKIDKKKSAGLPYPVDEDGVAARAYKDQWKIGDISRSEMELIKYKDKDLMRFCQIIGNQHSDGMEAYLLMMASRLLLCHELLKETGSIFLHCDHSANGYLRMLMDFIFGKENFRNQIVWYYKNASRGKRNWAKSHDTILYYAKNAEHVKFNRDGILVPFESGMTAWRYSKGGQADKEMPKGKTPDNVMCIPSLNTMAKERCKGWDGQKPLKLYTRLVRACTNPGDLVIDPFCGCSTTLIAAENAGCEWIGIDINPERITMLNEQLGKLTTQDLWKGKVHIIKDKRKFPKRKDNKPPKKEIEKLKDQLLVIQTKSEDRNYCEICKHRFPPEYLELDHKHPKANRGGWEIHNLQLLCSRCNRCKGSTKTNEQVRKELGEKGLLYHQRAAVHQYMEIPMDHQEEYRKDSK